MEPETGKGSVIEPSTDDEEIRTFEENEQKLADESRDKIKLSSIGSNFEIKKVFFLAYFSNKQKQFT